MAKANNRIQGHNIFYDKHGRPILYVKRLKRGYRISAELEKQYRILSSRAVIAFIVFIFLYILFTINLWISIPISIAAYIYLEWRYRKMLENCTIIENYEPDPSQIKSIDDGKDSEMILKGVLYLALGILLVVNAFVTPDIKNDAAMMTISICVAVVACFFGLRYFFYVIKRHMK